MGKKETPDTQKVQFAMVREEYINRNMIRKPGDPAYSLLSVAKQYKVPYKKVREIAARERWSEELARRLEEKAKQLKVRMENATVFDEMEIRLRQMSYARLASSVAMKRIKALDKDEVPKMSIKDAIALLQLGLTEERLAAAEVLGGLGGEGNSVGGGVLTAEQVFQVAKLIMDSRKGPDGVYKVIGK